MTFYDKFIELCKQKGVSPSAACVGMGLSGSAIQRWGKGTPTRATLFRMADYFEYDPVEFSDYATGATDVLPKKISSFSGIRGLNDTKSVYDILNSPILKAYYSFIENLDEDSKQLINDFINAIGEAK